MKPVSGKKSCRSETEILVKLIEKFLIGEVEARNSNKIFFKSGSPKNYQDEEENHKEVSDGNFLNFIKENVRISLFKFSWNFSIVTKVSFLTFSF